MTNLPLIVLIFYKQIANETADKFATCSPQEHLPLAKHMVAMAIRAISVAGMGRTFMMESREIDKLETMYEVVRFLPSAIMSEAHI